MAIFNKLFKKEEHSATSDDDILAVCDGELIPAESIADAIFSSNMMGKTIGFEPTSKEIVSPVNGTLEVIFPTGHAFGIVANDGTNYLVHIGIDTVAMNGDGFKALKKQGDKVYAGEKVVVVDFDKVKAAKHPTTTMLIITEPIDGKTYEYIPFTRVVKGQKINK